MRIVVTGSSGQLGAEIVHQLWQDGHWVTGIDLTAANTTSHQADILKKDKLIPLLAGHDAVIHTVSLHGRQLAAGMDRRPFVEVNILGTLNLLEASFEVGIRRFVFSSTTSIYGHSLIKPDQAVWVEEQLPIQPRDIYDITKQAAEELCRDFFDKEGLQTLALRVGRFFPEPPNDIANYRLYRGLDIRDAAKAHILATSKKFSQFEVFNLSGPSPFAKTDIFQLKKDPQSVILSYFPEAEAVYQQRNWHFPRSIERVYAIEKAQKLLDYSPQFDFASLLSG